MPPPHLHPRSRMTSSLFATTVLASFLVVALPHVLPCPAPARRVYYADDGGEEEGGMSRARARARARRTRAVRDEAEGGGSESPLDQDGAAGIGVVEFRPGTGEDEESSRGRRAKGRGRGRECPVPKPGGMLGEWLGFNGNAGREAGEKRRPDR
ncbi:hypothetical protein MYCTH_2107968 [Thermothelomyces thermophilus ATCC 42464]|uniref:Uncharacterized protein n=1 Tax=Thermothelomyces thermophilus (strain ATCC 42464 / BCRC 31852 / DSM 1799) TaxID=573729 RepID=G2Q4C3_THET4|nr:uncharacterized protein MYCTH_2107968 [Thermothelomyces thermophilus ATCC 42464]AEO55318.1 hypothetical protein MYCTH_2107968 [Thermothelomyces thermophilus ATCC 42464]